MKFRKTCLLKLMAERAGVDCRNVITGGELLLGLKAANARLMLEIFWADSLLQCHQAAWPSQ